MRVLTYDVSDIKASGLLASPHFVLEVVFNATTWHFLQPETSTLRSRTNPRRCCRCWLVRGVSSAIRSTVAASFESLLRPLIARSVAAPAA